MRHNLEVIRRLAPKSRVMAVIKANAYGTGSSPQPGHSMRPMPLRCASR